MYEAASFRLPSAPAADMQPNKVTVSAVAWLRVALGMDEQIWVLDIGLLGGNLDDRQGLGLTCLLKYQVILRKRMGRRGSDHCCGLSGDRRCPGPSRSPHVSS